VIKPHLDADDKNFVVLDRYLMSTYFYNIQPKPTDYIVDSMVLDQWFLDNAIPDLTIVFDLSWEEYRKRRLKRGEDNTDALELDMKQSFEMNQKMLEYPLLYSADALILGDDTVEENVDFIIKELFV
jgi:thymidylate kinase